MPTAKKKATKIKAGGIKDEEIQPTAAVRLQKDPLDGLVPGRIVYYWPLPGEQRHADPGPWPAMVTKVQVLDDVVTGMVTLNINLPSPTLIGTDPVARRPDIAFAGEGADDDTKTGRWTWMFDGQGARYNR